MPKVNTKLEIIGLINSTAFQKARICVEKLYYHHAQRYRKPEVQGLFEYQWDQYVTRQRRNHGGLFWNLCNPVVVFYNDKLLGSYEDLLKLVNHQYRFSLPVNEDYYKHEFALEYARILTRTDRIYALLEISIDKRPVGTLTFQLYSDLLPKTCENFKDLCTGELGESPEGIRLHYKNSNIHRIAKEGWIQGGDIENITGGGGVSVFGDTFPDECYGINHDRRGVISMANNGQHTNASQFFITLDPAPWMDKLYVGFGQLVEGVDVLHQIEMVETFYEKPLQNIVITDCSIVLPDTWSPDKVKGKPMPKLLGKKEKIPEPEEGVKKPNKKVGWSQEDVLDPRCVPSILLEERFLAGLYSMDTPSSLQEYKTPTRSTEPTLAEIRGEIKNPLITEFEDEMPSITSLLYDVTEGKVLCGCEDVEEEEDTLCVCDIMEDLLNAVEEYSTEVARTILPDLLDRIVYSSEGVQGLAVSIAKEMVNISTGKQRNEYLI